MDRFFIHYCPNVHSDTRFRMLLMCILAMLAHQRLYLRQILWMAMKAEEREITLRTPTMRSLEKHNI